MDINTKHTHSDTFFLLTVGVLLAWSLVAGMISVTVFSQGYFITLIQVFFIVAVLRMLLVDKFIIWISLAGIFVVVLLIAVDFFIYYPYYTEASLAAQAIDFIGRTIQFIGGHRPYNIGYERAIIWVVSIIASLFVVLFSYVYFRFWVLLTITTVIFSLIITSRFFSDNFVFYVFAFCSLAFLIKYLHLKCVPKSERKAPFTKYALGMTIFCLLLAILIPAPAAGSVQNGISNVVSRPFNNIGDAIYHAIGPRYFSLQRIGFGGGGRLGGDVVVDDRLIMRISSDSPTPIYLTGATMDTYTGYSWENRFSYRTPLEFADMRQNIELYERASSAETIRLFYTRVRDIDFSVIAYLGLDYFYFEPEPIFLDISSDSLATRTMAIDILNFRTSSVFYTGIVHDISTPNAGLNFLRYGDGRIVSQERLPSNILYTVTYSTSSDLLVMAEADYLLPYYELDRSYFDRGVLRLIMGRITAQYRRYGTSLSPLIISHNGIEVSYEDLLNNYLIPRADRIQQVYTALPAELPERVRDLAFWLTVMASSDYERARILEAYLSQNFVYTLEPGDLPPGRVRHRWRRERDSGGAAPGFSGRAPVFRPVIVV